MRTLGSTDVLGFGGSEYLGGAICGLIGGISVVFGGIGPVIGGIGDVGWDVWGFIGGTDGAIGGRVVLGVIDGVVHGIWGLGGGVCVVWGFLGGSDGTGNVVLGGPGLNWFLSRVMKASHVTASGPPSCLVLIRQLCRKLTGSSGRWYSKPVNRL